MVPESLAAHGATLIRIRMWSFECCLLALKSVVRQFA